MKRGWAVIAALILGCSSSSPAAPGALTGGSLTAEQERQVLEAVVRYGVREAHAPCKNYGSRAAYCLSVVGRDPETALLRRLTDVEPPVLALSECQRQGVIGAQAFTTDPAIDIEWLRVGPEGDVRARVSVYCFVSEPTLARRGSEWVVSSGGGWVGCGPVPGDCDWGE